MSIPTADTSVPGKVRELAGDARLEPVWRNELGGVTFRAADARGVRFVKFGPVNGETDVAGEAARTRWAAVHTPVPAVVTLGSDGENEWIVTRALPGENAVSPRWAAQPGVAVAALGRGLRALHDALPTEGCPFDWSVASRLENAARRGIGVPREFAVPPPVDRLVVCHGDACAPNTLIADDGTWSGHVDLGALGTADRWADIAVAAMSTEWNYGPGWTGALLDAYGIDPDPDRMRYYRDLWNVT